MSFNLNSKKIASLLGWSLFFIPKPVFAQLIPDNTLGLENSRLVPLNKNIDNITGGARKGANLFHSFQEFNVGTGRGVYFANPAGVKNVLTRVTGGNISNIFGTLGVDGSASLYLINPSGIYFGSGVRLDIRGSFTATTADGIKLGETGSFSAVKPIKNNLLSVKPGALFTNAITNNQKLLTNEGALKVDTGQNIFLSADAINNFGSITAPNGNIFLEALRGDIYTKTIDVSFAMNSFRNGGNISLSSSGNISLLDNSIIQSTGQLGGRIDIKSGGNLSINNAIVESLSTGSIKGKGKGIHIEAVSIFLNNCDLASRARIGIASAGDLRINTGSLNLINGAGISTTSFGNGNAGNLTITAKKIELIGRDLISGSSGLFASSVERGNSGNIVINTDFLRLTDGASVSNSIFSDSKAGDIIIFARTIELIGKSFDGANASNLSSGSFGNSNGSGGNINIFTAKLIVEKGAVILVGNFGSGNLVSPGLGKAGNITIKAEEINLNRGNITANGNRKGGGDITIDSSKFLSLANQSKMTTNVGKAVDFSGGDITINTPVVVAISNNNRITATAQTTQGGNININTQAIFGYPQFLDIDASSALGINGTVNVNEAKNLNTELTKKEPVLVSKIPLELAQCPLNPSQTMRSVQTYPQLGAKFEVEVFVPQKNAAKKNKTTIIQSNTSDELPHLIGGWGF